ncbi:MAG: CDP-diacylglycerol--glycerol-3-phosphate 3-phosphatidyltransferase [Planctomycetota bacterium]
MTFPMLLTLSRLVMAPTILVLYQWGLLPHLQDGEWVNGREPVLVYAIVFVLTVLIEVTDVLDGHLARKWKQVSDAGKFLDPLADSISRSTVFLCFLQAGYVPLWMVALVFYRESTISGLRIAGASQNVIIAARWSGKTKAILQAVFINVTILADMLRTTGVTVDWFADLAYWGMGLVTAVTVLSLVDYFRGNGQVIARLFASPAEPPPG